MLPHIGKLASAWENYVAVAKLARVAGMKSREEYSQKRAAALAPRLCRLQILVPKSVEKTSGLVVRLDDKVVPRIRFSQALPVDPGEHTVAAQAPQRQNWSRTVLASQEGATVKVAVAELDLAEDSAPATPSSAPADSPGRGQTIAGISVAAGGLAAMVVGIIVGVTAKNKYDSAEGCQDNYCDEQGFDTRESARSQGTAGTVVFAIGAAALVGGGVLWLTAPSAADEGDEAGQARLQFGVAPTNTGWQAVLKGVW